MISSKSKGHNNPKDVEKVALSTLGRVKFDSILASFRQQAGMDGEVSSESIEYILRANGLCPSLSEISEMKRNINARGGSIDLHRFLTLALECESINTTSGMSELVEFFSAYDPGNTGLVSENVFRNLMANCGERFQPSELDKVVSAFRKRGNEDFIDYRSFITTITGT